ncbi:MAG: isoleucine--tRNA ligase [Bacteriovoracaceae bacterium]|nr:isoleucine--tRNA ligase [Bacteriovoracaceae bacterium]
MSEKTGPHSQFSFVETEHNILNFWETRDIFKKSLKNTQNEKQYIFYDGPPFATGLPHHGHLVGNILKDVVPRYFTMKGFYVERRFGWDCHGLPIEHEIDKKLGMSAHEAIKELGIKGYNDQCRSIVGRYTSEWKKTIDRIGRWVDFENDYKTMDVTFMESVWWVVRQLWNKELIYKGVKVVPFSTAFGTVLSNFEATSNYKDVQDPAVTILYKLADEDAYLACWTTTPWTLPSNLAICVGEKITYVKVKDETLDIDFYIAKDRLSYYTKNRKKKIKILSECEGKDLKERRYEPLFPYFADLAKDGAFQVICDGYVTTDDGTGLVHTAPDFGEDDNRIMKNHDLHVHACPVDDLGKFTEEVTDFAGMYVKDADKHVIKWLKENGKLYDQDTLVHSYPFCERSNTPLIYKAIPSWYVNVEKIKGKIIEANRHINWIPDHIKEGRFGKWLEGAKDWAISRNRTWGTPIPIWENDKTGKFICIGSIDELEKYTGKKVNDLHREIVDLLEFTVQGESGTYKRIPEVLDCWFESGSMPYAQLHYPFENKKIFDEGFPAEYIAEGLDQTRGWFYTLTVLSAALYNKPAFKNVIVNGIVMAEDGKKMSKSLRNYTSPNSLMEDYGADALRLYLINSGLVRAEEQRFSDHGVKDMVRRALLPWYNSFKFFQTYAEVDNWNPKENFKYGDNITDRWILSNLQTLKKNIATEMEAYKLYNVVPSLFAFIEDLTNWYIRLNRSRFWGEGLTSDKCEAYSTLYTTLKELSMAMAPFTPFLSEHLYMELGKFSENEEESVHLCKYPVADEKMIDQTLEDAMNRMQQIILLGRQKRNQKQIKVKTPLRRITVLHKDETVLNEIKKLEGYIRTELNIKEILYSTEESRYIKLYAKPNAPVLGKRLGKNFGQFRKLIQNLPEDVLAKLETGESIGLEGETFIASDFLIFREAKEGTNALSNRFISIDVDCELDQNLIDEGLAREVVNRIQKTRKEVNLNVADRITIVYEASSEIEQAISKHENHITRETLTNKLQKGAPDGHVFEYQIENGKLRFSLNKIKC